MKSFLFAAALAVACAFALAPDASAQYGRGTVTTGTTFAPRAFVSRNVVFAPNRFFQGTGYNQTRAFVFTQPTYAPTVEVVAPPTFVTQQPATTVVQQPTYQQPSTAVVQQPTYQQPSTTIVQAPVYSTPTVLRTVGHGYYGQSYGTFSQPSLVFVQGRGFVRVR